MSETPEVPPVEDAEPNNTVPLFEVSDASLPGDGIPNHEASKEKRGPFGKRAQKEPTAPRTRVARKPAIPKRKGQFVQPLTNMYTSVGIMLMPFDSVCANAVIQSAEDCAKALDDLAYQNDAVRRVIYGLVQTSTVGVVIAAHAPIIMAIMIHHVPSVQKTLGKMGEQMAENVEAQMRAAQPPTGESDAA